MVHPRLVQHRVPQVALPQVGPAQVRGRQERPFEIGAQKMCVDKKSSVRLRVPEVRVGQPRAAHRGQFAVGSGPIRGPG